MTELSDYSGEFKNALKLEDFSKEFLIRMMRQWSRAYIKLDEEWQKLVKETAGEEVVNQCAAKIWARVAEASVPRIARALDIKVKDVVDVIKVWQVAPDGLLSGLYPPDVEIKSRNHVIFSIGRCKTLEYLERTAPHRIKPVCQDIDLPGIIRYLTIFLPDAEVKGLKIPSGRRPSQDDYPACQFEFKRPKPGPQQA